MTTQRKPMNLSISTDIDHSVERDTIEIDGVPYKVKTPDDFLPEDQAEFERIRDLWAARPDDSQVEYQTVMDILNRVVGKAFITPPPMEVLQKIPTSGLIDLAQFITDSWTKRKTT